MIFLSSACVVSPEPSSQKFFLSNFLYSVSNFLGFKLVMVQVSGNDSGIPLMQEIVTSNAGAWLCNATLRIFYLGCAVPH